jgi:hypothetical protein
MHQHTSTLPLPDKVVKEPLSLPPVSELQSRLDYNPTTGIFLWKHNNKEAGWADFKGYRIIKFKGICYRAHRLAWKMFHGKDPGSILDHIDRNRTNNVITNLREVDNSESMHNTGLRSDNTSGQRGVCWAEHVKKWRVKVNLKGKSHHLGYYDDLDQAVKIAQDFYERVQ